MSGYITRLQDAQAAGVFPAGRVVQIDVEHGANCSHDKNRSHPCVCHPRITAVIGNEVLTIGTHGHILQRRKLA